ncbi:MAG: hypothetical protein ABIH04_04095 [Planctomycetota bacterium]
MRKSPWIVLAIGLAAAAFLAVMGRIYLGYNPVVQLKAEIAQEYGLKDVLVRKDEETGMITITYRPDRVAFETKPVLEGQMAALARHARDKFSFKRVTVIAKLSDEKTHTKVFAPD